MHVGVGIPNCREGKVYPPGFATPASMAAIALAAEEAGFHSFWLNDLQTTFEEELAKPDHVAPNFYEAHVTLSYLFARTSRIRGLSAAMTAPLRDPILLAKQAATLDVLSGGRYTLGLGLGGMRSELTRVRGRFAKEINRGRWLDESLAVTDALLRQPVVDFEGEYVSLRGAEVYPKPVQDPFPIYLTGGGPSMLARAARWGSGWIHLHLSPQELAARRADLARECAEAGTDVDRIDICVQFDMSLAATIERATERWERSPVRALELARGASSENSALVGRPEQFVSRLSEYIAAGMTHVGCVFVGDSVEDVVDQIEMFGDAVLPELTTLADHGSDR